MSGNARIDLPPQAFDPVGSEPGAADAISRPSITYWRDALRRLRRNRVAMLGFFLIAAIALMAVLAPLFSAYDFATTDLSNTNASPSAEHWFGTDTLGRDLWVRVWTGARVSLLVGVFGAIIPCLIGIVIGGVSGYFGGRVDMVLMRMVDIACCVPQLIYVILIMIVLGAGPVPIIIAFAITGWMGSARNVRGLVLQLKEREFVLASRALGASPARLIFRHLVPNTLGIVIVGITMAVPAAIFYESYLSFIGLGIKPPIPSWGQLASMGVSVFRTYPTQLFIPALFICLTMLSFNLFGDGLRDALDPRLRK